MQRARLCRFANQDIYRLLGRDPNRQPLTTYELALFERAIFEVVSKEYSAGEQEFPDEIPDEYKDLNE